MQTLEGLRIFSDATAIITGGASGIGRTLAEELAMLGCDVVFADLQTESVKKIASNIRASRGKANAVEDDKLNIEHFELPISPGLDP